MFIKKYRTAHKILTNDELQDQVKSCAMSRYSRERTSFLSAKRRAMEAAFAGDAVSSETGLPRVREADRVPGLIRPTACRIHGSRQEGDVRHGVESLPRQ